jgi:hypothetical protein
MTTINGTNMASGTADEPPPADDLAPSTTDRLNKILDALASPEQAQEEKTNTITSVVDELYGGISLAGISSSSAGARAAVDRYRNAMRWLVGAVAAIGVVLFGSVGFTEGDIEGWQPWIGLGVAATGLVLVLGAATKVFEPQEASLGHLEREINSPLLGSKWVRRLSPTLSANYRLKEILEGPEKSAHLGPGNDSIGKLIAALGTAQRDRAEPARCVWLMQLRLADLDAERKALDKRLSTLGALTATEHRPPAAAAARLTGAMKAVADRMDEVDAELGSCRTALREKQDALVVIDQEFGVNLLHRSSVLNESGVAHLRGRFNQSRRLLFLGAILTLVGTILYISAIKSSDSHAERIVGPSTAIPVIVNITSGGIATDVPSACTDKDLNAVLFAEDIPDETKPFLVYVSENDRCVGQYSFPPGRTSDAVSVREVGSE